MQTDNECPELARPDSPERDIDPQKIKLARRLCHYSMDELCRRMGKEAVSKTAISKIERGIFKPSADTLRAMAKACGVTPDYFYQHDIHIGPMDFRFSEGISARKAEENVVIRPITRDDEADNRLYLPIEAILVDLAYEAEFIMDGWDYGEVVRNVLSTYTIDPQVILRRISRRRFASGNMVTLCEALFREGIESDSVRALYSALKKGEAG